MSQVESPDQASAKSAPEAPKPTFLPLHESPYAVESPTVRERFWFADGAWLDSGPTPAVVGFAWTHWLADRGLRVSGVEFDEDFALELQGAAQMEMGQPRNLREGAYLSAAGRVLLSRGLLEQCYTCADIETLTRALLERGPVLAGATWYDSLNDPKEVDGRIVYRIERGATQIGSHAYLLNGIDLDLELGGSKGFVRFKNSWGRDWGDQGQALMSIEDLTKALEDRNDQEVLLPIPSPDVLGISGRQDVGIFEADVRFQEQSISTDYWTTRDTAGYSALANAIARGIQHPDTKPPLTVGIRAPWGAGKTSLMRMIQQRLEWPTDDPSGDARPGRDIELTGNSTEKLVSATKLPFGSREELPPVTNRVLLRKMRWSAGEDRSNESDAPERLEATPKVDSDEEDRRWRPTAWFNPWMYQTGEQVWAGLAHEIITQTTDRMSRREREHFWLQLNLKRIDEQAVRRQIYSVVIERVIPWGLTAVLLLATTLVLLALDIGRGAITWLTGGGSGALAVFAGARGLMALGTNVSGSLSKLVGPSTEFQRFAETQLKGAHNDLVDSPDYRNQTGSFYLIQTDVRRVLDLVAKPSRPLIIFVDDLDRCSPSTVVQVIEAINLFLAGQFENAIFVIAMEPEMVAAHIETAYAGLVTKLAEVSGSTDQTVQLGWKFLDKIVQLPLTLPAMDTTQIKAFYESQFQAESGSSDAAPEVSEAQVQAAEQQLSDASLSEAVRVAGSKMGGESSPTVAAAVKEAARRIVERKLARGDPEVEGVINYARQYLDENPREIKRFIRVFRFFVMIYAERGLPGVTSLHGLGKLAVLAIRWPALMGVLAEPARGGDGRILFDVLEDPQPAKRWKNESQQAADRRALKTALTEAGLSERTVARLLSPQLREFMRSGPKVGDAARGYL